MISIDHSEYDENELLVVLTNPGIKSGSVGWSNTWTSVPGRTQRVKNGLGIIACVSTSISPVRNHMKMSKNTTASTKNSRNWPRRKMKNAWGPLGIQTAMSNAGRPSIGIMSKICRRKRLIWSVMNASCWLICSGALQPTKSLPTIWDNGMENVADKCLKNKLHAVR